MSLEVDQWFEALQKVIESMDQVERLAYRARDHAREKYGWFNQWKAIEEALLDRPESQPVIRTSPQISLDSSAPRSRANVDSTSAAADRAAKNLSAVDPSGAASW